MAKTQEELNTLKNEYESLTTKLKELSEEELQQVFGGGDNAVELVDGKYHFILNTVLVSYEQSPAIIYYSIYEDKYATIDETVRCLVRVLHGADIISAESRNVNVSELIKLCNQTNFECTKDLGLFQFI